ncbi:MAG: hypothetical protein FJ010_14290 [Chloroflexi bacterium]|nr:hypothetical protein [Chloroflexota bacterium]
MKKLVKEGVDGVYNGGEMRIDVAKRLSLTPTARRVALWVLIAGYTFILPSAILIYRRLESAIGQESTGKIPLYGVLVIGTAYILYGFFKNRSLTHLLSLVPCAIIAYVIIRYEPNPNKHIHIPEYTLMAWLLYAALSRDYQGKGIFILIFLCGSMLGVVDELEQGLHPKRFYGWSDMTVNSSSTLIGIFTILGLTRRARADWKWKKHLKELGIPIGLILFGLAGAVLMCIQLFQVQARELFWGVYPLWLLAWSILFVAVTPVTVFLQTRRQGKNRADQAREVRLQRQTAQLWVYPAMAILFYMHAIIVFIALTGYNFR